MDKDCDAMVGTMLPKMASSVSNKTATPFLEQMNATASQTTTSSSIATYDPLVWNYPNTVYIDKVPTELYPFGGNFSITSLCNNQILIAPVNSGFILFVGTKNPTAPKIMAFSNYNEILEYMKSNELLSVDENYVLENV